MSNATCGAALSTRSRISRRSCGLLASHRTWNESAVARRAKAEGVIRRSARPKRRITLALIRPTKRAACSLVLRPTPFCSQRTNRNRENQRAAILNSEFTAHCAMSRHLCPVIHSGACNTRFRCRLICLASKSNLAASHAAKQHDGQISKTCPVRPPKIFRFRCRANQWFLSARLTR